MAFCTNCGHQLAEDAKFCFECGTKVEPTGVPQAEQRKVVYEGKLHKCPNCGETLNSFSAHCPTCGHEIRDSLGVLSVRQLAMKLGELESKRPPKRDTNILVQSFGLDFQLQSIDEQKIDLIRNFSIPNTKEDVMEFIVLAAGNIDLKVYGINSSRYQMIDPARRELSDAWLAKLEQAYTKAQIMFGGSQEYINIQQLYQQKIKDIKRKRWEYPTMCIALLGVLFLMFGIIMLMSSLT